MTLPEIARLLNTSTRSLNSYVSGHFGEPPAKYMRRQRLLRVRALLLAGECVTRAAYEVGFWNLGQLSRYYRTVFGELPSETLQRGRP
jgi:AraC family ethanolamine operon transcriptional activator